MFHIGVQTHNVVNDRYPEEGFTALARAGFSCADFSLNAYLDNSSIHQANINSFFNRTILELENFLHHISLRLKTRVSQLINCTCLIQSSFLAAIRK